LASWGYLGDDRALFGSESKICRGGYGEGNERRLTGKHETASMENFSAGVGNRGCSIRIPNETKKVGYGYLEDRRPASNMDPYVVTAKLVETTCLDDSPVEKEEAAH